MDIITMRLDDLKPYSNNTKEHPQEQIDEIKESIARYGMNDPIAIWGKSNVIVEGHGRFEALRQMGIKEAPCIRLDHLTDKQRREYTIAHNPLHTTKPQWTAVLTRICCPWSFPALISAFSVM